MTMPKPVMTLTLLASLIAFSSVPAARAASLTLSCETTSSDGINNTTTPSGCSFVTAVPNVATSYGYNNTVAATPNNVFGTSYGFYDDYVFSIANGTVNSVTTTIDLGTLQISNLQERLYSLTGNALPTLGTPSGTLYDAWTSPLGTSGQVAVLPPTTLGAGTYVLEIRGTAGPSGGSYGGVLNVTPVPLPASMLLTLSALGLLGGLAMKRADARGRICLARR